MSPTYTEDPKEFNSPLASTPFTSSALQMDNRTEEQQKNHVGDDDGQQLISTSGMTLKNIHRYVCKW